YADEGGLLRPGHAQHFFFMALTLAAYSAGYGLVLTGAWQFGESTAFPPLLFTLLLIMLVGFLLTALAFCLDYYRVSTLVAVAVVSYMMFRVNDIDHFYELHPDVGQRPTVWAWLLLLACLALGITSLVRSGAAPGTRLYRAAW